jgi:predicted ribosomally synthesized peptide with SipW-like signal peptide
MRKFSSTKRAKIMAIAAAGLIVGVGGSVTLAAWVDNEWVYGGTGGDEPGVGTSEFIVQQDANAFTNNWDDYPENPGDALTFAPNPLALTPGDTIYATVALHTTSGSVAGSTQLQSAVVALVDGSNPPVEIESDDLLFDALDLRIGFANLGPGALQPACDANAIGGAYTQIVSGTGLGSGPIAGPQPLLQASGNVLHYCFEISMPTAAELEDRFDGEPEDFDISDYMGLVAAPAWEFISTSAP